MNFFAWILYQLASYGFWWALFIAVAVVSAMSGRWRGVLAGHCVIAVIVLLLDIAWIRSEMSRPDWSPETGPDMDIVFDIGVLIRVVFINLVLMPVSVLVLRKKKKPNQALEPTPMSVTSPAAQEPRRP